MGIHVISFLSPILKWRGLPAHRTRQLREDMRTLRHLTAVLLTHNRMSEIIGIHHPLYVLITDLLVGGWDKPVGHFALAIHSRYDGLHIDHRLSDQEGVGETLEYPFSIITTELSMVTRQHLPSEIKYVKANIPVFLTDQRTLQHCQPGRYEESNRHTHKYFSSFFCNRQSGGL